MLNSTTLEVAIGMALVYLILSLFCTAINEAIAGILSSRARNLERGIKSLFTEGNLSAAVSLTNAIYRHGLVQSLYRSGIGTGTKQSEDLINPPSYIPSRTFASALYDVLFSALPNPPVEATTGAPSPAASAAHLAAMLAAIDAIPTKSPGLQAIRTLVKQANGDVEETRSAFEHWYDDGMDRAAGWYKKRTQMVLFVIGLVAAVVLNVDSISVARTLWINPAVRSFAITYAETVAKDLKVRARVDADRKTVDSDKAETSGNADKDGRTSGQTAPNAGTAAPSPSVDSAASASSPVTDISQDLGVLNSLNLPIGWRETVLLAPWSEKQNTWPLRFNASLFAFALFGWILTAIAMTLGAPFWFDTLNQFMVVRSTIKPREKSDVEGSKN
jgi:hypothetical protein